MPKDCPKCGNAEKVYDHGHDPIAGDFVLCSAHGIQVCEKKVEQKTEVKKVG